MKILYLKYNLLTRIKGGFLKKLFGNKIIFITKNPFEYGNASIEYTVLEI